MTAEIAILNKTAVALATDSAVTITTQKGQKIFNTANKLFMLSKHHPIGIMLYGNADFMGVPWESIVKIYREQLGEKSFNKLKQYQTDFIKFLETSNLLFPDDVQLTYFEMMIYSLFSNPILKEINEHIEKRLAPSPKKKGKGLNKLQIKRIITAIVNKQYTYWKNLDFLPQYTILDVLKLKKKYNSVIMEVKDRIFQELPFSKATIRKLIELCLYLCLKKGFSKNNPGVVIAGFGKNNLFPVIVSFKPEIIFNNTMKYEEEEDDFIEIGDKTDALIAPFAQRDEVASLMNGIHPHFQNTVTAIISKTLTRLIKKISEEATGGKEPQISNLNKILSKIISEYQENMWKNINDYSFQKHVKPIMSNVGSLPKDELALMAETFINLTSFKRRMSTDLETVGGPIDVAVISKGDGFVWIKRKHYFKPELNSNFFKNY
ncbi:MAG: hypothetical protein KAU17_16445 [Spirochaetales bacterium]|nr:hypothetical protein [Spirochaetales bacterium]